MAPEPESTTAVTTLVVAAPSGEVRFLAPDGPPELPYVPVTELASPPCASGAEPCGKTVTDLAVRPGSVPERLVYATRQVLPDRCLADIALFDIGVGRGGYGGAEHVVGVDGCPTAPVWSPDGGYVAWAGGSALTLAPWNGANTTGVDLPPVALEGLDDLADVEVMGWVGDDAAGEILVRGVDGSGRPVTLGLGVTTDASGGVTASVVDRWEGEAANLLAVASGGGSPGFAPLVRAAGDRVDGAWQVELTAIVGPDRELPSGVLDVEVVDPSDPAGRHVWISSAGGTVLLGDGVDDAWVIDVTAEGWGQPVPLGIAVRAGAVLEPGAIPPPPRLLPGPG